jgi:protein-S-isoprenylcysteine O-methyltransferase Ste14
MNKYFTTIAMLIIIYVVPLLGNVALLVNIKMFILMIACSILFLSQPSLSAKEAREKQRTDKNSLYVILAAAAIGQIISVIDWGYIHATPSALRSEITTAIGLLLMGGGICFRLWAIRTLGRFFTTTVQIKENHEIIELGPYRVIRHPSYIGSLIAIVGSTLFLNSVLGCVVAGLAMVYAYRTRIAAEEETLVKTFGSKYIDYQQRTAKLIPYIW